MIKIITKAFGIQLLQQRQSMAFCVKQIKKKSADITNMFTDKAITANKSVHVTAGMFMFYFRKSMEGQLNED